MRVNFLVNDYVLAWSILFNKSITNSMQVKKQKIWNNYRKDYTACQNDIDEILCECKNYIPNNDTVYNILFEDEEFIFTKKMIEKNRLSMVRLWDSNIKKINYFTDKVIRKKISNYTFYMVCSGFDIIDLKKFDNEGKVILGKDIKLGNKLIVEIMYKILSKKIYITEKDELGIRNAIIELACLSEFSNSLGVFSTYKSGSQRLEYLKRQIYPYWLMYLGIKKENMVEYMLRDKIKFDQNAVAYEKELINMNLEEFIEFVIRNRRYIIKEQSLEII